MVEKIELTEKEKAMLLLDELKFTYSQFANEKADKDRGLFQVVLIVLAAELSFTIALRNEILLMILVVIFLNLALAFSIIHYLKKENPELKNLRSQLDKIYKVYDSLLRQ